MLFIFWGVIHLAHHSEYLLRLPLQSIERNSHYSPNSLQTDARLNTKPQNFLIPSTVLEGSLGGCAERLVSVSVLPCWLISDHPQRNDMQSLANTAILQELLSQMWLYGQKGVLLIMQFYIQTHTHTRLNQFTCEAGKWFYYSGHNFVGRNSLVSILFALWE